MTGPLGVGRAVRKQSPDFLVREIADLKRDLRELRQSLGAITGMTFLNGSIKTNDFNGVLDPPAAGSNGWAVTAAGVGIFSQLALADGIIGDDALANPVATAVVNNSNGGLNGSSSAVTVVSANIPVPAGFTRAQVLLIGSCGATCNASGGSYIEMAAQIGAAVGHTNAAWIPAGVGNGGTANFGRVVTGLSGGNITVQMRALETTPANIAAGTVGGDLSATAVFLR